MTRPSPDDIEDFSRVVDLHRPVVYRFLLASLRDADLAESLTQECFLKAYRYRLGFRGESSVRTWLLRIAINLRKDHWRDRRALFWRQTKANAVDLEEASDWLPSADPSPEEQTFAREKMRLVLKAVRSLNKRQRAAFLLHYLGEHTVNEIGQRMGLSEATVKLYLSRARRIVRARLAIDREHPSWQSRSPKRSFLP
jgi:RNA polymerase sigma-70 factor, ECF subfamily